MISGWAVRLGHTGVTATTSSPASTRACTASIRALTPPEVIAMRSLATGAVQAAGVLRDRVAQLGQAQVVGVEGFALLQRFDRRLADEVRRDLVAFAEPERQHVAAPHAGIGDFADLGFFEVLDGVAHGASLINQPEPSCRSCGISA